ncbi:MAG: Type 1 glutamine amidotransferase-like domain-containing protein [Synoicihabitans sp.]
MTSQIIALGGGGFSMEPDNPLLDHYVLNACPADTPRITLLPTASGDADRLIAQFYTSFHRYPCRPRHVSLFRQTNDMAHRLLDSDVIYVTGGNTRNMLAIWEAAGVTELLREAWESGIVLAGVSAGAICWFEQGHTDSRGDLSPLDCMGWLSGSCSPHYDGEVNRKPSFENLLQQGQIKPGLALDDGVAAHYVGAERTRLVSSRPRAQARWITTEDGLLKESRLSVDFLG